VAALGLWGLQTQAIDRSTAAPPEQTVAQAEPAAVDSRLISANTRFGFKLFSEMQRHSEGNMLISPSSVSIALAMTYNGASGETQQAMAQTMELSDLSVAEINQANAALLTTLETADTTVELAIANSLWGRADYAFRPEFLQRNQDFYEAEVDRLDFASADAVDRINRWVDQQTQGKIPTILDQIDPNDVLFLINATYFKGSWTQAFDPDQTLDRPFYLADGTQKPHPMMTQTGEYRYLETDQFQAVRLPYGQERFSFYVFLPRQGYRLSEFQATLNAENWEVWLNQLRVRNGAIQLPRFQLEYSAGLKDALATLGMAPAFDPDRADFTGISPQPVFISSVRHKTFIEVNEAGTEAAAVTAVITRTTSAPVEIEPPFEMTIDRPFFYAIRDDRTGAILFMGTIVNPQS
jgi:serpin B